MKRLLNPATNPNGWTALLAAAYAIVQAVYGHTPADPRVWMPAVVAFVSLLTRQLVTPVSDPRIPGNVITDPARASDIVPWTGPVPEGYVAALRKALEKTRQPSGTLPPAVQPPATTSGPAGDTP